MTSTMLAELLKAVAMLCVLLLAGTVLRAKVPLFRKLLLPASVIGGFIGLLLGPNVMGKLCGGFALLPFPQEYLGIWAIIPGILIVPIFAAAPLGNGMDAPAKGSGGKSGMGKYGPSIVMMMGLFSLVGCAQSILGYGTNLLFSKLMPNLNLYRTFGWELAKGYSGGHGTAAAIGGILEGYGIDYWEVSQGVGITTATFGLLGGMILGILFINRAAKKGEISNFKAGSIPLNTQKGVVTNVEEQKSIGRETTLSSCIDPLTVHLGLILIGCGLAYFIRGQLMGSSNAVIKQIFSAPPVWFYALLVMYGVNFVLVKLKLNWMVDKKVKSRVTGSMSDIAITAAVASCDVEAVMVYIVPILFMCILGFVVTYFCIFPLSKKMFGNDYAFERAIISWGTNTGVMVTGMMLLKICDPDYETPALTEFSMGFALMCVLSIPLSPIEYGLIQSGSTFANFMWAVASCVLFTGIAMIAWLCYRRSKAAKA